MRVATKIAGLDRIDDALQHHLPLVNLRRHHDVGTQSRLVRLRAEPHRTMLRSHTRGTNHHLRRARQHIRPIGDMTLRSLRSQRHITKGLDVVDIDLHTRILRRRTSHEPIHIQLRVTNLDRTHHTDHTTFGQRRSHRPHHIPALIRRRRVRRHIVETKRVVRRTPRKRRIREIRSDLLQRPPVLRTMRNHQVITILRIRTHRSSRLINDERPIRDMNLRHTRQRTHTINDALRERQVIRSTRRNNRNPELSRSVARRRRSRR